MFVKKKLRRPLIVQLHGLSDNYMRKWCYLPCLLALKQADRILYSYEPEKLIYEKLGITDKVVKLPFPGVDPGVFRPQKRHSSNRLLYVGRIPDRETAYGEKSPFLLIRIFERLLHHDENVSLDIVGDGPGLPRSRKLAQSLDVADHVSFHGYVDHKDLPAYYRASALTFSPIQLYDIDGWIDGAIQESLACGTPVVALRASAKARLRGTYGFLLSNNTEEAAEELHELLKAPEEMNQVAREGSRFVRENCSRDKVVSELDRTLEGMIRN
jgi:glycosyltransferase involved in cell wall biosynthesis